MIEVIPFVLLKNEYFNGILVNKVGDKIVSHGVNHNTGENVVLPQENFDTFVKKHCFFDNGCWILK